MHLGCPPVFGVPPMHYLASWHMQVMGLALGATVTGEFGLETVALPPETRDSAVSVARNRLVLRKTRAESLASRNFFPAEFPLPNRDAFECRS